MRTYLYILFGLLLTLNHYQTYATEPPHGSSLHVALSGVVLDDSGEPLPYATIFVKGTTLGTTTDISGNYSLELHAGEYEVTADVKLTKK